jgi:hypothetical protein
MILTYLLCRHHVDESVHLPSILQLGWVVLNWAHKKLLG